MSEQDDGNDGEQPSWFRDWLRSLGMDDMPDYQAAYFPSWYQQAYPFMHTYQQNIWWEAGIPGGMPAEYAWNTISRFLSAEPGGYYASRSTYAPYSQLYMNRPTTFMGEASAAYYRYEQASWLPYDILQVGKLLSYTTPGIGIARAGLLAPVTFAMDVAAGTAEAQYIRQMASIYGPAYTFNEIQNRSTLYPFQPPDVSSFAVQTVQWAAGIPISSALYGGMAAYLTGADPVAAMTRGGLAGFAQGLGYGLSIQGAYEMAQQAAWVVNMGQAGLYSQLYQNPQLRQQQLEAWGTSAGTFLAGIGTQMGVSAYQAAQNMPNIVYEAGSFLGAGESLLYAAGVGLTAAATALPFVGLAIESTYAISSMLYGARAGAPQPGATTRMPYNPFGTIAPDQTQTNPSWQYLNRFQSAGLLQQLQPAGGYTTGVLPYDQYRPWYLQMGYEPGYPLGGYPSTAAAGLATGAFQELGLNYGAPSPSWNRQSWQYAPAAGVPQTALYGPMTENWGMIPQAYPWMANVPYANLSAMPQLPIFPTTRLANDLRYTSPYQAAAGLLEQAYPGAGLPTVMRATFPGYESLYEQAREMRTENYPRGMSSSQAWLAEVGLLTQVTGGAAQAAYGVVPGPTYSYRYGSNVPQREGGTGENWAPGLLEQLTGGTGASTTGPNEPSTSTAHYIARGGGGGGHGRYTPWTDAEEAAYYEGYALQYSGWHTPLPDWLQQKLEQYHAPVPDIWAWLGNEARIEQSSNWWVEGYNSGETEADRTYRTQQLIYNAVYDLMNQGIIQKGSSTWNLEDSFQAAQAISPGLSLKMYDDSNR